MPRPQGSRRGPRFAFSFPYHTMKELNMALSMFFHANGIPAFALGETAYFAYIANTTTQPKSLEWVVPEAFQNMAILRLMGRHRLPMCPWGTDMEKNNECMIQHCDRVKPYPLIHFHVTPALVTSHEADGHIYIYNTQIVGWNGPNPPLDLAALPMTNPHYYKPDDIIILQPEHYVTASLRRLCRELNRFEFSNSHDATYIEKWHGHLDAVVDLYGEILSLGLPEAFRGYRRVVGNEEERWNYLIQLKAWLKDVGEI
ncbi:hypothetical protein BDV26DRAFT_287244 [Aspergillus bertholletiae]|uniref:Uncharacterized protein n=1 Tax=Aspergillus bertholletiae TaxID=1226010 RepID=A0A5N7BPX8_9EURO|nr:hypothetical protein BDV26DRAFT_287244 [Aspergillus bertholletiae]